LLLQRGSLLLFVKTVLFVCVHNAGRSQMAEAMTNALARQRGAPIRALSAGTVGGKSINLLAVQAMEEIGISMKDQKPKLLTAEMIDEAGRVISMGCGVEADACPAGKYLLEDWALDDPSGLSIERVREIRDQIQVRVKALVEELVAN
jgi:protein-tyrosine-phosphatase